MKIYLPMSLPCCKVPFLLALSFALALSPLCASSGLLAYEGFNYYMPGEVPKEFQPALGKGFAGRWQGGGGHGSFVEATLEYGKLVTSPGALRIHPTGQFVRVPLETSPNGPFKDLLNAEGKIGKEWTRLYVSFLARAETTRVQSAQGLLIFAQGEEGRLAQGHLWEEADFSHDNGDPSLGLPLDDRTHLFVLRIEWMDWGTKVTYYLDPDPTGEEALHRVAGEAYPGKDFSFDSLLFKANANAWIWDEIRIGLAWRSVLPTR